MYGLERALLDANTASDAEFFGNLRDLGGGRNLYAQFAGDLARRAGSHADDGTRPLALLAALLRLALISAHDGDPRHLVSLRLVPLLFRRHFFFVVDGSIGCRLSEYSFFSATPKLTSRKRC